MLEGGLEPPPVLPDMALNHARLPIPPLERTNKNRYNSAIPSKINHFPDDSGDGFLPICRVPVMLQHGETTHQPPHGSRET